MIIKKCMFTIIEANLRGNLRGLGKNYLSVALLKKSILVLEVSKFLGLHSEVHILRQSYLKHQVFTRDGFLLTMSSTVKNRESGQLYMHSR